MPRHRIGTEPMSPAERQARHRAQLHRHRQAPAPSPAPVRPEERIPARSRVRALPRPIRWAAAVTTLVELQEEYRAWLDHLPTNLDGSPLPTGQARGLKAHDKLQAIDPPRGYGRD